MIPSSRGFSSTDNWLSKPFPGFWTCRRGLLLWRPPWHSITAWTEARAFRLLSIDDHALGNLIRVYWHTLCRPCRASNLQKPCARLPYHYSTLKVSSLKRSHEKLLRLLIDRPQRKENLDVDLVIRTLGTLQSKRVHIWTSRDQRSSILNAHKRFEDQTSGNSRRNEPDELNQESKRALENANHIPPSGNLGVARTIVSLFVLWARVTSLMGTVISKSNQVLGLCDPLLASGKTRVRWRCVRNPSFDTE